MSEQFSTPAFHCVDMIKRGPVSRGPVCRRPVRGGPVRGGPVARPQASVDVELGIVVLVHSKASFGKLLKQ